MAMVLTADDGRKYRLNYQEADLFEDVFFDCQLNDKGQTHWEECIERLIRVSTEIDQTISKSEAEEILDDYHGDDFKIVYKFWDDDDYAKAIISNRILVRPITPHDCDNSLPDFFEEYEAELEKAPLKTVIILNKDEIYERAEDAPGYYYGAFLDDKMLGIVSLGQTDGQVNEAKNNDGLFSELYVLPSMRRMGVGTALVDKVINVVYNDANFGNDLYAVVLDDDLIDFYRKLGFSPVDNNGTIKFPAKNVTPGEDRLPF